MYVLAENIYAIRQIRNMTQEELANLANLSKATISNYENDVTRPSCATLHKIADALGVTVRELFEGIDKAQDLKYGSEDAGRGEVHSHQKPLVLTGIPYWYIYEDENGEAVICVSLTGECMQFKDYKKNERIITQDLNTYYIVQVGSDNGEQLMCGKTYIGEIIETRNYDDLIMKEYSE